MNYIYLIGPPGGGAARTRSETMAAALEQASGYHRCTQREYLQRMDDIRALDLPAQTDTPSGSTKFDRTASDPASTTPAGTPATPLAGCQQPRQQKEPL